jgi:hypothetical protein
MCKHDIYNAYLISHDIVGESFDRTNASYHSHPDLLPARDDLDYVPDVRRSLLRFEQDKVVQMVVLTIIRDAVLTKCARFFC